MRITSSVRKTRVLRDWLLCLGFFLFPLSSHVYSTVTANILAGGESDLPADTPSGRLEGSGRAEIFRYDFDTPATTGIIGGSLGNDIETIIGPGDSGGAALRQTANGWELIGINTFTEGYGGRFGDTGGGVLVEPYTDWISQTTGIPEPSGMLMLSFSALLMLRRRRCHQ